MSRRLISSGGPFEAVAGYRPFDRGERHAPDPELRYPQLVDPPYEMPDGTPHEVVKIVFAALEPDPADRPLPHELAEALLVDGLER